MLRRQVRIAALPSKTAFDSNAASLAEAFARGREAWPHVRLTPELFAARIESLGIPSDRALTRAPDLYLAAACAAQLPAALAAFDRGYIGLVPMFISRLGVPSSLVDEVAQRVRVLVLSGRRPRIETYAAQGTLEAWMRLVATRVALDLLIAEGRRKQANDQEALGALVDASDDPELHAIKAHYQEALQQALEDSLTALDERQKTLLRMHVVDGRSIDAIGLVYRVHRATVARWLIAIRRQVFEEVKRRLAIDLRIATTSFHSLVEAVRGELRVSLDRVLKP
jgi:RNA polymerase sigma-70 factor, ECF subfamily